VTRYTNELHKVDDKTSSPVQIALRNRMELFIATAERLLSKLAAPPAGDQFKKVTTEMQERTADEKVTWMKIAMNQWADVLQERLQVDVHLETTEPAPEGAGEAEGETPEP
jgi:hypothetical protein